MSIASRPDGLRHVSALLATMLAITALSALAADESPAALQKRCDASEGAACQALGMRYEDGDTVVKDLKRAVALYRRSCDLKHGDGCLSLGMMYRAGLGVAVSEQEADRYRKLGCKLGPSDPDFCRSDAEIAEMMAFNSRLDIYEKQCADGNAVACYEAAELHYAGIKAVASDTKKSAAYFAKACDGGHATACSVLGFQYSQGEGVVQDKAKAAALYDKACKSKQPTACLNLGLLHSGGEGVAKDQAKAAALFKIACDANNAAGCHNLANLMRLGEGVPKDVAKGVALLQTNCAKDYALSCRVLGSVYFGGTDVTKDVAKAATLFEKACAGQDASGCYFLGLLLDGNLGISKDTVKAKTLFARACELGEKKSCALLVEKAAAAANPAKAPAGTVAVAAGASAACRIVKVQLGIDTVASVERDIQARGGSTASSTGPGQHRLSALTGDYRDAGAAVMAVNYDFDASAPTSRLISVTIVNHANDGPGFERLLAARKAAAATIAGPLQQKSATEFIASTPNCSLRFLPNAGTWFIHEVYELPK